MATPRNIRAEKSATGAIEARWKLEDAKARFSEVVRHAQADGPQRVSVRGRDAVVIVSVEDFDRLTRLEPRQPFVAFMESLRLEGLDLMRDPDHGRDIEL